MLSLKYFLIHEKLNYRELGKLEMNFIYKSHIYLKRMYRVLFASINSETRQERHTEQEYHTEQIK